MKSRISITLVLALLGLFSCTEDRVIPETIVDTTSYDVVHYWNFNDNTSEETLITPTYSIGGTSVIYEGSYYDDTDEGSLLNARNADEAGNALRLRNPSGDFTVSMPTTGYDDVIVTYAVRRTSSGPQREQFFYTVDGANYVKIGLENTDYAVAENFVLHQFDFQDIPEADNNPEFKIKITFDINADGDSGNSRFDNLTLDGIRNGEPIPDFPDGEKEVEVFHYWNFNNADDLETPNIGAGSWSYSGDEYDDVEGATLNALNGDEPSTGLRLRNPSGDFILSLPTSGYENVVMKFAVQRSGKGATSQNIYYSVNGTDFIQDNLSAASFEVPEEDSDAENLGYVLVTIDFSAISDVNNNEDFKVKFSSEETEKGNTRYDNITLEGTSI
ncbi:hypothetical protein LVD15_02735 [Fulvivirga maritima]|uniref:hypothetical protein n=1 Tax=Fulvivirga maritima TaxID=2904247 RepID=UPI001F279D34|nr:hypothetical protein [Fulvivirga maritima]UII27364.1 hypothetical protein LVD15_02735 [Fulvivirga maritima]